MTRQQFQNLKVGDTVILNGKCRTDAGAKCKVTYIIDDRIWVQTIDGKMLLAETAVGDWNEVSYTAANIV